MNAVNPLPIFTPDEALNLAAAPLCVVDVATRECVYCGGSPVFPTYADYLDNFWRYEYEGEPYHAPVDEEYHDLIDSLCLATAAE